MFFNFLNIKKNKNVKKNSSESISVQKHLVVATELTHLKRIIHTVIVILIEFRARQRTITFPAFSIAISTSDRAKGGREGHSRKIEESLLSLDRADTLW